MCGGILRSILHPFIVAFYVLSFAVILWITSPVLIDLGKLAYPVLYKHVRSNASTSATMGAMKDMAMVLFDWSSQTFYTWLYPENKSRFY